MPQDYNSTLNLPKTDFPMRAGLPKSEPVTLKRWEDSQVYETLMKNNEGKPLYVLHDGPPYANGNIHLGHAMNKVLKDIIVRYKNMTGFKAPYVPGWDTHGLPTELKARAKAGVGNSTSMSVVELRKICRDFALGYIDDQRTQFKRLGAIGEWNNPYITLTHDFEAKQIRIFSEMAMKGYIYRGLKPVYWCPECETALAEAEIEYAEDPCHSIYVKFRVTDDLGKLSAMGADVKNTYFVIWTTTTWTLPGNQAIALNPAEPYVLVKAGNGETYILAEALAERTMQAAGIASYETVASFKGQDFEYMTAQHPFLNRESLVVVADYVTMESGTGCVHTAGGFGADDNVTCRRYGLPPLVPVDDRGYQTEEAGKFAGLRYDESNKAILADLKESGALFASEEMQHEYPHCWRCKNPIIFRATPQWFCSVEAFKDDAVKAADKVQWLPEWGGERMKQMIRERADWCISRQRHWGLPIPVFYCDACKKPIVTDETINAVSEAFAESGSNVWYEKEAAELLPSGFACPHCGGKSFFKETDTLDGWFDSGSSHFAARENGENADPADLYLEGADQYRGWFQSSLLTSVGAGKQARAPYKTVLTHGWVVDGEGKAMHKSLGNTVLPSDVIPKYGADLVRLWVASADYRVDVRVSDPIFRQLSDAYRKIRNTARILIADLNDFNPDADSLPLESLPEIDRWIVSRMNDLTKTVRRAYDDYEFHIIYHEIGNFCTNDLSKLYIDITKDRVYTEKAESEARRAAQTAMYFVLSGLTRLLAPILAFTAEEMWQAIPHRAADVKESVYLNDLPTYNGALAFPEVRERWDRLFEMRDDVMKALELARAEKLVGKSLEAKITLYSEDDELLNFLSSFGKELETVFIVSGVSAVRGTAPEGAHTEGTFPIGVLVETADGCKCDRCWSFSTVGKHTEDGGFLCERCRKILGE